MIKKSFTMDSIPFLASQEWNNKITTDTRILLMYAKKIFIKMKVQKQYETKISIKMSEEWRNIIKHVSPSQEIVYQTGLYR